MLGAIATKQGILLATITHYDIVPASYLTCLLPKSIIYAYMVGLSVLLASLRSLWVRHSFSYIMVLWLEGGARAPKAPSPYPPLQWSYSLQLKLVVSALL